MTLCKYRTQTYFTKTVRHKTLDTDSGIGGKKKKLLGWFKCILFFFSIWFFFFPLLNKFRVIARRVKKDKGVFNLLLPILSKRNSFSTISDISPFILLASQQFGV